MGLTQSNSIDLGIHNEMESLENLTTFNQRHEGISEKKTLEDDSKFNDLFKFVMAMKSFITPWDIYNIMESIKIC